jgi:hypothetical protein
MTSRKWLFISLHLPYFSTVHMYIVYLVPPSPLPASLPTSHPRIILLLSTLYPRFSRRWYSILYYGLANVRPMSSFMKLGGRVGRFLTKIWFWMKVPSEYVHFYEKIPKIAQKNCLVKWPPEERSFFAGSSTIQVSKIFVSYYGVYGYQKTQNLT